MMLTSRLRSFLLGTAAVALVGSPVLLVDSDPALTSPMASVDIYCVSLFATSAADQELTPEVSRCVPAP